LAPPGKRFAGWSRFFYNCSKLRHPGGDYSILDILSRGTSSHCPVRPNRFARLWIHLNPLLSRRDQRTKPGVSTPGTDKGRSALKGRLAFGVRRSCSCSCSCSCSNLGRAGIRVLRSPNCTRGGGLGIRGGRQSDPDLVRYPACNTLFCRPFQGGLFFYRYLGLKPQAESFNPFGISPGSLARHDRRLSPNPYLLPR
jgi:hypothetical protein